MKNILKRFELTKFFLVSILISSLGCGNIFHQIEVKSPDGKNKFILHNEEGKLFFWDDMSGKMLKTE